MTDPASSPAAVGRDSAAAAAATITLAYDRAERAMLLEILELQDKVHELLMVMRKQKIDCTYVAERRSIICKLQVTDQVQALQKLIACMLRDSEEYATLDANISRVGEWVQGNGSRAPEPWPDSQQERSGLMSRDSPTSSRDRRKRPRASEESEDSELKDSAPKRQTSQENPCISEAIFIASEKFATWAVQYMRDRLRREGIPVNKNTIGDLQNAYGSRIQNFHHPGRRRLSERLSVRL